MIETLTEIICHARAKADLASVEIKDASILFRHDLHDEKGNRLKNVYSPESIKLKRGYTKEELCAFWDKLSKLSCGMYRRSDYVLGTVTFKKSRKQIIIYAKDSELLPGLYILSTMVTE